MPVQWMSVAQAAEALGVSASTVRRRIERGMLAARADAQGVTRVEVPRPTDPAGPAAAGSADAAADPQPAPTAGATEPAAEPAIKPDPEQLRRPIGRLVPEDVFVQAGAAASAGSAEEPDQDEAARFRKLAGASLIVAQRQADLAEQRLAEARGQVLQLRKLCVGAGVALAGVVLLALVMLAGMGVGASRAHAEAQARQELADRALTRAEQAEGALTELRDALAQTRGQLAELRRQHDRLAADRSAGETAASRQPESHDDSPAADDADPGTPYARPRRVTGVDGR